MRERVRNLVKEEEYPVATWRLGWGVVVKADWHYVEIIMFNGDTVRRKYSDCEFEV